MTAYYNEHDPFAADWLRNLIADGLLPAGDVDERDIQAVPEDDLRDYRQVHLFAGIGGWPLALRMAGAPDDAQIWTGSCPCQPFSAAGKRKGRNDERHLWPTFHRLIAIHRPPIVFGEQVESKDGRDWLADVRTDLEGLGYAVGAADLCAAGVGAPHRRQRLFWGAAGGVADADSGQRHGVPSGQGCVGDREAPGRDQSHRQLERCSTACGMDHPKRDGRSPGRNGDDEHDRIVPGSTIQSRRVADTDSQQRDRAWDPRKSRGIEPANSGESFWSDAEWIQCCDGVSRPAKPEIFPLADGLPGRVGVIRAAGNAVVPQAAAAFVAAFLETIDELLSTSRR